MDIINLYNACQHGTVDRMKEILDNFPDSYNAAINWASNYGNFDVVKALLQDGRADPANRKNRAINHACENGHTDVVELLLQDERVDPNNNCAINYASENGHADVVSLLLRDGRVDPSVDDNYVLRQASKRGHIKVVEALLKDGRVETTDHIIRLAATQEIKDMLIAYKYRVDGKEYCRLKDNLSM